MRFGIAVWYLQFWISVWDLGLQFWVWDCSLVFIGFPFGVWDCSLGMGLQFAIYWIAVLDLMDCRLGFEIAVRE